MAGKGRVGRNPKKMIRHHFQAFLPSGSRYYGYQPKESTNKNHPRPCINSWCGKMHTHNNVYCSAKCAVEAKERQ